MTVIIDKHFIPPVDATKIDLRHISDVCGALEAQAGEELGEENWRILLASLDPLLHRITSMAAERAGAKRVSLLQLGIGASLVRRVVDEMIAHKGEMYIQPVTRQ
jgi:hypothetical protein